MPLAPGSDAPPFALPADDGSERSLEDLSAGGPVVLAFFKTSCPTCRMSFPVYAELHRRYGDVIPVVPVAQDPIDDAAPWLDQAGFKGLFVEDHSSDFATSDAYEIQSVPTLVMVEDGKVVATGEGWDRERANAWAVDLGERTGRETGPVSVKTDGRPPFRPG